eukprot:CAMPEP_0175165814 /NCGR_PEP_ID=MMETSP0087-20121206/27316_1 /TAXON_ID=136419 /ORGANISM="Unknown Unknown, Strain D1" /LENGTH=216 /DNA_ID=CAMNT_0016455275 /DNA_START=33 /DNA_END=683 /DNA_ORIENTATION=-
MSFLNQIVHSPFCALMFGCQCRSLWRGGWDDCNVHREIGSGPRCPWCFLWIDHDAQKWYRLFNTAPDQDGLPVLAMSVTALTLLIKANRPRATRFLCCLAKPASTAAAAATLAANCVLGAGLAYFISASAVGFVWGRAKGYPFFFFGDSSVKVNTHNQKIPTALQLWTTLSIGTWGGVFWSFVVLLLFLLLSTPFCTLKRCATGCQPRKKRQPDLV